MVIKQLLCLLFPSYSFTLLAAVYSTGSPEKQTENIHRARAKEGHPKSLAGEDLDIWYFRRVISVVLIVLTKWGAGLAHRRLHPSVEKKWTHTRFLLSTKHFILIVPLNSHRKPAPICCWDCQPKTPFNQQETAKVTHLKLDVKPEFMLPRVKSS